MRNKVTGLPERKGFIGDLLAIAYDRINGALDSWIGLRFEGLRAEVRGIPHLAKNERDAPNFLHAALGHDCVCAFL